MDGPKKFEGKHSDLTGKILGAFFQVQKELGFGFSEKVYESALEVLLTEQGLIPARQKEIHVYYHVVWLANSKPT
jgi:GxxExxY protein